MKDASFVSNFNIESLRMRDLHHRWNMWSTSNCVTCDRERPELLKLKDLIESYNPEEMYVFVLLWNNTRENDASYYMRMASGEMMFYIHIIFDVKVV